ncbi:MAG: SPOR domain-containing protein [Armatimonadota bacterium]
MDSDNSALKWTAAAVGVILVCFCLGYYVLGPNARPDGRRPAQDSSGLTIVAKAPPATPPSPGIFITEKTAEIEAKRKKAAEEAKKKAEEEEKKKAKEEEEKKKAEEEAAEKAALTSPSPDPTPTPESTPTPEETATPEPTPTPESTETPTPATPTPTPTPAAATRTIYRVRVGGYDSEESARSLAAELNGRGYSTSVVTDRSGLVTSVVDLLLDVPALV